VLLPAIESFLLEYPDIRVELAVDYAVPDISNYVRRVVVMRDGEELEEVYRA
jgi:DNA-binding transcriptional LysR family regulator